MDIDQLLDEIVVITTTIKNKSTIIRNRQRRIDAINTQLPKIIPTLNKAFTAYQKEKDAHDNLLNELNFNIQAIDNENASIIELQSKLSTKREQIKVKIIIY